MVKGQKPVNLERAAVWHWLPTAREVQRVHKVLPERAALPPPLALVGVSSNGGDRNGPLALVGDG